jgi:tetratricopeptide (TPR) repeat protein
MSSPSSKDVLRGAKVALTGRFACLSHAELAELIADFGGEFDASPNRGTRYLVVGQEGLPLAEDGRPTLALQKARQLAADGNPVEIVAEEAFLSRLGLGGTEGGTDRHSVHRRYTAAQLGRILGVPGQRIRGWVRCGLIQPVQTVHRLAFFDFYQVASASTLCELTSSGLSAAEIRQGLEQLRALLPDIEAPLAQINLLEKNPRMLVRLASGQLAEPSGQLQLEFAVAELDGASPTVAMPPPSDSVDAWFNEGVAREDDGQFDDAARAYQAALALEPDDPVLRFNLGNVLFQLDQLPAAAEQYRQAVSLDPAYAEAWNNLGHVLFRLSQADAALAAFRRALALVPTYADAHYNLAQTLTHLRRSADALSHWRAYLKFDPSSPWADEARRRLAEDARR